MKTYLYIIGIFITLLSNQSFAKDPYLQAMQAYAKETQQSFYTDYLQEVQKVERANGYIGAKLPLPPLHKVADGVYTLTGALMWATQENFGLNNNFSFVIFEDGVFVFNAGPNPAVAYSAHQLIKSITDKSVKWIAIENNQGHANLGASYWWDVGVRNFYSQSYATEDFHKKFERTKARSAQKSGEQLVRNARDISLNYQTFNNQLTIQVGGGETVELRYFGEAHTRGSTVAYIPSRKLLFTGDLGYADRMIAVFPYTNTQDWLTAFEKMRAFAGDEVTVIPGHGGPSTMQKVKTDTYDSLVYMRDQAKKLIAEGKGPEAAEEIDQTQYHWRPVYQQTYLGNARKIINDLLKHPSKDSK